MSVESIIRDLKNEIVGISLRHPVRVGINGIDASGKTFFAASLANALKSSGRQVIQLSIDDFHNPRAIRYQKGVNSPEGFYRDSFNQHAIIEQALRPLGPGGSLKYKEKIFDFNTDLNVVSDAMTARRDAILIMEGIFLFHPALDCLWDFKIFVHTDFDIALKRAIERDREHLGSEKQVIEKYRKRYIPGQKLYFQEVDPKSIADIIIDNNDYLNPKIMKISAQRLVRGAPQNFC